MKRNASIDIRATGGARPAGLLELCVVLEAQRAELRSLLGPAIRLEIGALPVPGAAVEQARRAEIVDLLRHLALDARDAMPAGGVLAMLAGTLRTAGAEVVGCAVLVVREVRDEPAGPGARSVRKGRGLGLAAACSAIESAGGHLLISCRGRETVTTICFPSVA